jgi:hypothetical protein
VPDQTLGALAKGHVGDVTDRIRDFIASNSQAALKQRKRNYQRGRVVAGAAFAQVIGLIALLIAAGLILGTVPRT